MMEKIIHYSRDGYEGNYKYKSVCGRIVKTHPGNEGSDINPNKANCPDCLNSDKLKIDLNDSNTLNQDIKRRIYIESDILQADEFRSAQREAYNFAEERGLKCVDRVFNDVLDFAWHDLPKTWESVKNADEIYATSSLMPLTGGSYNGATVIFNGMCERSVKENVTGKSVIILNSLKNIYWDMIDKKIMRLAFVLNDLYMYNENYDLVKIDVSKKLY